MGSYDDPNHPGCPRAIGIAGSNSSGDLTVSGQDYNSPPWELTAQAESRTISVDFSPKGGPNALLGNWTGDAILWSDGNSWKMRDAAAPPTSCRRPRGLRGP